MVKYYAVKEGRSSGIYKDWSSAKAQVDGYSGNQCKSFSSAQAAQSYMKSGSSGGYSGGSVSSSHSGSSVKHHTVYTDGASRNNQGPNARAGYGVFYGQNDPKNVSKRLSGDRQDNNRAELAAVKHAVDNIHNEVSSGRSKTKYTVATDSSYAKNSLKQGASNGGHVENRDLIKPTAQKIKEINSHYQRQGLGNFEIEKVKGHSDNYGNSMADRLAKQGADRTY